jgi:hypothetical protein
VDFNRIGLVMAQSAHSVGLNTARVKSLTRPPSSLLTRPTNPNPNRSPHSRDSELPAASQHDPGEPRRRLPMLHGAINSPPWPSSSHRGKSPPLTSLAPAESISPPVTRWPGLWLQSLCSGALVAWRWDKAPIGAAGVASCRLALLCPCVAVPWCHRLRPPPWLQASIFPPSSKPIAALWVGNGVCEFVQGHPAVLLLYTALIRPYHEQVMRG